MLKRIPYKDRFQTIDFNERFNMYDHERKSMNKNKSTRRNLKVYVGDQEKLQKKRVQTIETCQVAHSNKNHQRVIPQLEAVAGNEVLTHAKSTAKRFRTIKTAQEEKNPDHLQGKQVTMSNNKSSRKQMIKHRSYKHQNKIFQGLEVSYGQEAVLYAKQKTKLKIFKDRSNKNADQERKFIKKEENPQLLEEKKKTIQKEKVLKLLPKKQIQKQKKHRTYFQSLQREFDRILNRSQTPVIKDIPMHVCTKYICKSSKDYKYDGQQEMLNPIKINHQKFIQYLNRMREQIFSKKYHC